MHIVSRIFGARKYEKTEPGEEAVAAVDVERMIEQARSRGDERSEDEVIASLLKGAQLTAERHPDPQLRRRAGAAEKALRDRLVDHVGEEQTARLVRRSAGPIGEDGTTARRPRRR